MRLPSLSTSLLSLTLMTAGASAATAGSLTRIETRPVYGAIVTVEEGVRVYRPLPSHRHVIINPEGKTPLSLSFEERNIYVQQYQYSVDDDFDDQRFSYGGSLGFVPWDFRKRPRVRHHHRAGNPMIHVPSAIRARARTR